MIRPFLVRIVRDAAQTRGSLTGGASSSVRYRTFPARGIGHRFNGQELYRPVCAAQAGVSAQSRNYVATRACCAGKGEATVCMPENIPAMILSFQPTTICGGRPESGAAHAAQ